MSNLPNFPTIRPSLLLDFANSKQVDPRISFTRASTATYFDANGVLRSAASGVPRIDHDPATGECKGLLIEEARTNLLLYSEQFDNAAWAKLRSSVTTNATVSPDSTLTADKLVEDTTSSTHCGVQTCSVSPSTTYTFTAYLKAAERTRANVLLDGASGNFSNAYVDLSAGTFISGGANGTFTGYSSSMTLVGNGWYRLTLACAVGAGTTSLQYQIRLHNSVSESYTGDGSSGIYIWGAQLEAGSFPTSYIPTTTAQVTRAADAVSMVGTNFSEWFNPLEGAFVFAGSIAAIDMAAIQEHYLLSVSNGNAANHIALRGVSGTGVNAGAIRVDARCVTASADQADTADVVVAVNSTFAAAVALKSNDLASSTNASTPSTDTSVTLPSVNALYIGAAPTTAPKNAHIKRISYYPKRLTNAELQALTA